LEIPESFLKAHFCHQKRCFKAKNGVKNAILLHDYGLLAWSDPKAISENLEFGALTLLLSFDPSTFFWAAPFPSKL